MMRNNTEEGEFARAMVHDARVLRSNKVESRNSRSTICQRTGLTSCTTPAFSFGMMVDKEKLLTMRQLISYRLSTRIRVSSLLAPYTHRGKPLSG
jgi:hypothetical protein